MGRPESSTAPGSPPKVLAPRAEVAGEREQASVVSQYPQLRFAALRTGAVRAYRHPIPQQVADSSRQAIG